MLIIKVILEGLGSVFLLYLICAIGIHNGAIGLVHLYDQKVQNRVIRLSMTTEDMIRKRSRTFKGLCVPGYMVYVLICVYLVNGARGFLPGFWQSLMGTFGMAVIAAVISGVMSLIL